jgi:hypothetical protein
VAKRRACERHDGDADSIANEFQCQPGHDKGCEKDRQEPLSCASEGDGLFLGRVEGLNAARVSSTANLQGVTSSLDWYLDRVVHFDRPDPLAVDRDVVRAATDLRPDCLMRQLQRRRHSLVSDREKGIRGGVARGDCMAVPAWGRCVPGPVLTSSPPQTWRSAWPWCRAVVRRVPGTFAG